MSRIKNSLACQRFGRILKLIYYHVLGSLQATKQLRSGKSHVRPAWPLSVIACLHLHSLDNKICATLTDFIEIFSQMEHVYSL